MTAVVPHEVEIYPLSLERYERMVDQGIPVVRAGAYAAAHPPSAELVVEVSDTSLVSDLGIKADVYAAAGVPELWVVDVARVVAIRHRDPRNGRYRGVDEESWRLTPLDQALPMLELQALRARLT